MIALFPLARVRIDLGRPMAVGGGRAGARYLFEVAGAELSGDRLRATLCGADESGWTLVAAHGAGRMEGRWTLRTPDGAEVTVECRGRCALDVGLRLPLEVHMAAGFVTSDPRYAWLNRVQAVGTGVVHEDLVLTASWYQVR